MDNILPTEQFTEVEGRVYENPQTGIDESNRFIDQLRAIQSENTQKISQDTQNLGTSVPSQLGGLTGADSYFTSRYQTPQTNATVASLRATAQAAALNDVLENEQAIWKKRYNDAYRAYQKREYNKANTPTTNGNNTTTGGVDENPTDKDDTVTYDGSTKGVSGYYTVIGPDGRAHLVDMETGEETVVEPSVSESGSGGHGYSGGGGGGGGMGGW